jgi:hypothetical protein
VIVLKVHIECIAIAKAKGDAEWAIDMDAPDAFAYTLQFVEVESRQSQVVDPDRTIYRVQPSQTACHEIITHALRIVIHEEAAQSLVPEAPYHEKSVNWQLTDVNPLRKDAN